MRVQLKKSSYSILSFIALTVLISACGKSNKMAQFVRAPQDTQTVIPTLDPFANGQVSSVTNNIVASLNVVAAPSQSANVGQVIYLFAYGSSSNSYNFQLGTNSIGASFVGSSTGVQQVGVTSSGAGSVTVTVTTAAGTYSTGSITLNFTGSTTTPASSPYSSCSIQGPYAISNYYSYGSAAYPQVGGSYYFSVQSNASSLNQGTSGGACTMAIVYSYYFNGTSCQLNTGMDGCAPRGPFNSLSDCQQAVAAGRCGGNSGGTPVTRQVYVDSRATQWVDTGVDVSPSNSRYYTSNLSITTSGQVNYGQGSYSSADGVGNTSYHACKAADGQSFRNIALIGKIGVNGAPFLVGSYLNTSVNYSSGRLYLIVNDTGCASDNSGSFVASISFQSLPFMQAY